MNDSAPAAQPTPRAKRQSVARAAPEISAVVPVYNEVGNITELIRRLDDALSGMKRRYEIIIVDDGSRDGTDRTILDLTDEIAALKPLILARNYGQSTAMQAGFEAARGDIVVSLDGDLQNDPADIPRLIETLESRDIDVVSGWRKNRKDDWLRVNLSKIANKWISRITHVELHDYGCSLKAYRRDVLEQIRVYGELHRFIPALLGEVGANIAEIEVNHHPRTRGQSKYHLDRTVRVFLDMILIVFLRKYIQRPMHIFGSLGLTLFIVGTLIWLYLSGVKFIGGEDIGGRPLLLLGAALNISGLFLIMQGLLGEITIRLLHETRSYPQYRLKLPRKTQRRKRADDG